MTSEEIAELRQRRYNATVVYLQQAPLRPDGHAGEAGLPATAAPARPVLHARPGLLGAARRGLPERDAEAGRRDEGRPPGVLDQLLDRSTSRARLCDVAATDWLEFYIVLVRENPDGRVPALTPRLFTLKEGDRLHIGEKITGHYTLDAGQAGRHGRLPRHRHRRGPAQLHALGTAPPRPHGQDPLGLLRPLSPATWAISTRTNG